MTQKQIIKTAHKLVKPIRVAHGWKFRIKDVDPGDTLDFSLDDKPELEQRLAANGIWALAQLQARLYGQNKWAALLIFSDDGRAWQGRHHQTCNIRGQSAGLPGLSHQVAIRRGTGPRTPLALHEVSAPSQLFWNFQAQLLRKHPRRRIHQEFLTKQRLPPRLVSKNIRQKHFHDI